MICLFEDRAAENFTPLTMTRHVSELLVGTMTLRRRTAIAVGDDRTVLHARGYLRDYYRDKGERMDAPDETTLLLNARLAASKPFIDGLPSGEDWVLWFRGDVLAARLKPGKIARLDWSADALDFSGLSEVGLHEFPDTPRSGLLYEYLWDLIEDNGEKIRDDFAAMPRSGQGVVMQGAHVVYPANVELGAGAVIKPGTLIHAGGGPVIIGDNVEVMPNAVIIGPCWIGDDCRIKAGAKIYEKTSIGPWCKVGGEVENSIILGYSNKQHDGFLGHSYLGAWVNLGADTNTSDLKNNYGTIRVMLNRRPVETGRMFVGSLIGDHVKTAINTMLNTGTVIGICANVFGTGFPPKAIPPFAWGGSDFIKTFRLDEALDVARTVMQRRKVEFTAADEALLRYLFGRYTIASTN